jgi:hypothetical protein
VWELTKDAEGDERPVLLEQLAGLDPPNVEPPPLPDLPDEAEGPGVVRTRQLLAAVVCVGVFGGWWV